MTKVVFSEGKHDVYFLKEIHNRAVRNNKYNIYLANETEDSQTKWLRQNKVDPRFDFLYKSEGGTGNVIKQIRSHSLMFTEFSLYILVDLDDGPFSDFLEEMNGKMREQYGNKVQIITNSRSSNQDMLLVNSTLQISGSENRDLPILAFDNCLEDVTGIVYGEDRSAKITKIQRYLDSNPSIQQDIASMIYIN